MSDERECCCGREIARTESGEWDHVDGSGVLCWPGDGMPEGGWKAEPIYVPFSDPEVTMEADLETSDLLVDNAEEAYKEAGQELVRRHVRIGQLDATVKELTDLILRLDWQNIHTHYGHTDCEDCEIVADLRFRFSEEES